MRTRILTDAVGADPALSPHSPFVGETALQGEIRLQEGLEIISGIFTWCIAGSRLWIKHRIFFVRFKYKNIPENVIEIPDGPEELIAAAVSSASGLRLMRLSTVSTRTALFLPFLSFRRYITPVGFSPAKLSMYHSSQSGS
jgi:hypothetical protein